MLQIILHLDVLQYNGILPLLKHTLVSTKVSYGANCQTLGQNQLNIQLLILELSNVCHILMETTERILGGPYEHQINVLVYLFEGNSGVKSRETRF